MHNNHKSYNTENQIFRTFRLNKKYLEILSGIIIIGFLFIINGCNFSKKNNELMGLVQRLVPTHVDNFIFEEVTTSDTIDYFELESRRNRIIIRGSNPSSIGVGLNWYLKYYCNSQISWNSKNLNLPEELPVIDGIVRKETSLFKRFYLNYCTYSYSMAWWDWERWEKEIDWMVLHGINMPLMIVGEEAVWQNTLRRMNYSDQEIKEFLSGPGFFAWFFMNNLEGWGGPLPDSWIADHIELRQKIQKRMKEYGMTPVFQGFYGMVPSNLNNKYPQADIHNPGLWCGFTRPAFLLPTDSLFQTMSDIYYQEQEKLFGKAAYYAGDPFHEGGNTKGVDLKAAGDAIYGAMKKVNPESKWVMQSWQGNPRRSMIDHLPIGDVVILDLHAEDLTKVEDQNDQMSVSNRFGKHNFIWSMVHNYGGNTGLYGKLDEMVERVNESQHSKASSSMVGIGATPEGIENNPVVYELLFELPWYDKKVNVENWLEQYIRSRYGESNEEIEKAWKILHNTVYKCPRWQQGTTESVLCARPAIDITHVSGWGNADLYYNPKELKKAWQLMMTQINHLGAQETFRYDLVDLTRQVLADLASGLHKDVIAAYKAKDLVLFQSKSQTFLELILDQDMLLSTQKEFQLGRWIDAAKAHGHTPEEKALYEWNARVQITTWGPRIAADNGQLHEYAHKEWAGLLKDFYYPRWKMFFENLEKELEGKEMGPIDFYAWEEKWTQQNNPFPTSSEKEVVNVVKDLFEKYY